MKWIKASERLPDTGVGILTYVFTQAAGAGDMTASLDFLSPDEQDTLLNDTFLNQENINKAELQSDKDVFQAIGEKIKKFPLPSLPTPSTDTK